MHYKTDGAEPDVWVGGFADAGANVRERGKRRVGRLGGARRLRIASLITPNWQRRSQIGVLAKVFATA